MICYTPTFEKKGSPPPLDIKKCTKIEYAINFLGIPQMSTLHSLQVILAYCMNDPEPIENIKILPIRTPQNTY